MTTYLTTPIYYVNDRPHIGHCYTTTVVDAMARFARLIHGKPGDVLFLTGTDEHADKVVTTAAARGLTAIQWADHNAEEFRKAFAFMGSSNDDFIRTTQDRHKTRVEEYVSALLRSGAIDKGSYEGWYDENQEEYVTETAAKDADFKSAVTGKPLVRRREDCYFFRLSRYQARLEELFARHPDFVQPEARRNEVLGRLRQGLQDVPVSRPVTSDPATQFGIRVPGDPAHRIYVWIDALFNYLTVVDTDERRRFWPAPASASDTHLYHFIAKDILWFHAVIWPAMLLALRDTAQPALGGTRFGFVGLPSGVYSHAYWVREGRKMSKSLGNFVDIDVLHAYADAFSIDALRWYLLTQGPLGANDTDFAHAKFVEVYNADLANGIGNCASRVANMIEKYFGGACPSVLAPSGPDAWPQDAFAKPSPTPEGWSLRAVCDRARDTAIRSWAASDLEGALRAGRGIIAAVDEFISASEPFKIAKTVATNPAAKDQLARILAHCAEAIRVASVLLSPALITRMPLLWTAWNIPGGSGSGHPAAGTPLADLASFGGAHALRAGHQLAKGEALFMRADPAAPAPTASPTPAP